MIYLFDNDKKLIDILTDTVIAHDQKMVLGGAITATATARYSKDIEEAHYFGAKDIDDPNTFWMYRITSTTKESGKIQISGIYLMYDELQASVIRDIRPTNLNPGAALSNILSGSLWQVGINQTTGTSSSTYYYQSRLSAFYDFLSKWKVEFKPRMTFSNGVITGRYIDIYDYISKDYGKRYEYGDKLINVVAEQANEGIYTALIGRGKGEETESGGFGRRITFKDVVWSAANGDPVDKPSGQDYVSIPSAVAKYGFREATVEFTDTEDPEVLLKETYAEALYRSRPRVEFKSDVIEDERAELGEVVTVVRDDLGIRYKTRIFEIERSFLNKKIKSFKFGDKITVTSAERIKQEQSKVDKEIKENQSLMESILKEITKSFWNEDGYNYELKADNEHGLPAGYYSFDRPIDQSPTKVVYMGAGKVLIADSKNAANEWVWRTAITPEGLVGESIIANTLDVISANFGTIIAGRIQDVDNESYWDLDNKEIKLNVNELKIKSKDVATKADLTYTSESLTAKFSQIGGRNLLRSSKVNLSNSAYPTGTFYMVEPMEEGETYTITVWGSLGANKENFALYLNGGSLRLTYLEKIKTGMYQATFEGVSGGAGDYVNVFPMPQSITSVSKITHVQLEKGSVGTDWSPAPEEFYEGIVKIDLDGIEVGVSNSTIKTLLQHDGMRIVDNTTGNEVAQYDQDGAKMDTLEVKRVISPHVANKVGKTKNYYVYSTATGDGSGRDEFNRASSVQDALRSALDDAIVIEKNAQININISGAINEDISINGISGHGKINILGAYGSTRVAGRIYVQNTPCPVYINGVTFISVEEGSQLVYASGLCNVFCEAVRIDGANQSRGFRAENGAIIRVEASPVVNCTTAYFADYMSTIYTYDTYGQGNAVVADARKMSRIGLHYRHPSGTVASQSYNGGEVQVQGTATASSFSYTPPAWSTISKTFVAELETANASSGYVWRTGTWTQGSWDGQAHKGTADFGTRIKDFLEGSGGYQNISNVIIKVRRNKSSGRSNPVSLKVTSPTSLTLPAVTLGASSQANANATIISAMQSGSLKLQSSTTSSSDYAGFDRIEITFSVQKKV